MKTNLSLTRTITNDLSKRNDAWNPNEALAPYVGFGFKFVDQSNVPHRQAVYFRLGAEPKEVANALRSLADAIETGKFVVGDAILEGRELNLAEHPAALECIQSRREGLEVVDEEAEAEIERLCSR